MVGSECSGAVYALQRKPIAAVIEKKQKKRRRGNNRRRKGSEAKGTKQKHKHRRQQWPGLGRPKKGPERPMTAPTTETALIVQLVGKRRQRALRLRRRQVTRGRAMVLGRRTLPAQAPRTRWRRLGRQL
jgi:hypothetical protein